MLISKGILLLMISCFSVKADFTHIRHAHYSIYPNIPIISEANQREAGCIEIRQHLC